VLSMRAIGEEGQEGRGRREEAMIGDAVIHVK
jgi:hypothetical protein